MDAGGRATQEQLPSLHVVNEHFFGKFNDAGASEVIFQSFLRELLKMQAAPSLRWGNVVKLRSFADGVARIERSGIRTTE
jgi:hypothetical protein